MGTDFWRSHGATAREARVLGFAVFGWASVIAGWLTHDFPIGFFAVLGSIPFGYIGGTIGRKFAAERSGE